MKMAKSDPVKLPSEGLVLTRKRKKWKFAHFDTWPNCFSHLRGSDPRRTRQGIETYLGRKVFVLEIAAGNAQFSLELASRNPEKSYIAIDVKSDRLYFAAKKAQIEGITNIAFLKTHVNEVENIFKPSSIEEIWLTFPDPFPKKRSSKHRLTHPHFLQIYQKVLAKNAPLRFKTDNHNLFLWSLEQFVAEKWSFSELSFDLHESDLPDDYKIKTYYEERYTKEGLPINLATLVKK